MIPANLAFTMYVGTTFGPYFYYFNATKTRLVGDVTVDEDTDFFTLEDHGLSNDDQVRLTTTGQRPYPLTSRFYFVRNKTTDTFQLATSSGGIPIDITDSGFGVHTVYKRGLPADITDWLIWSWVKHSVNDPDSAKIVDLNPTITDGPNGLATFYVTDEATLALDSKVGDHVQSLILQNTDGERLGPYVVGPFYIRRISTSP